MYPRAFLERVLSRLEARGHLGPRARARVFSLLSHGLHPEQVLIGSGIVDTVEYQAILKEVTGFSVHPQTALPSFPEGLTREESRRLMVLPVVQEGNSWHIGYVEPWNQATRTRLRTLAETHGWQEEPAVLLFSAWRQAHPLPSLSTRPHLRVVRTLRRQAETALPQHTWFVDAFHPRQDGSDVRIKQQMLPGSQLPAFIRRLQRAAATHAVKVELRANEHGPLVLVKPLEEQRDLDHPTTWLRSLAEVIAPQEGLSLLLGVDPAFTKLMEGALSSEAQGMAVWRDEDVIRVARPKLALQEGLVHAVLAGKSALVHVPHPQEPWWEALQGTGVPVRIIHKQQLPEGESWVSYEL